MVNLATTGYTVDDLHWLRNEIRVVAHLELDPWGSLIVSPTDDKHETAAASLIRQAVSQLSHTVSCNGFAWVVPGGSGYLTIPDLMVLAKAWQRVDDLHFDPPPLLVVEIASPSTRHVDRSRKLADYRLGRADQYLLVDLPNTFELHDFAAGTVVKAVGQVEMIIGGQRVWFTLPGASA